MIIDTCKIIRITSILLMILCCLPWLLTTFELIDTGYHGFGVDFQGTVYLGKHSCIRVYLDGALVGTIQLPDYRYYWMTVENDYIVIAGDSNVEKYTLQWELVSKESVYSTYTYHTMRDNHASVTVNNTNYTIQRRWFQQTIVDENGVVHYVTPKQEIIGSIGCSIFSISLWCLIIMHFAKEGLLEVLRDKLRFLLKKATNSYLKIRGY